MCDTCIYHRQCVTYLFLNAHGHTPTQYMGTYIHVHVAPDTTVFHYFVSSHRVEPMMSPKRCAKVTIIVINIYMAHLCEWLCMLATGWCVL